jgi:hypothetical protein
MTRSERDLEGVVVRGSDHLTTYNLYAEAYRKAGYTGEVYGLPRHLFREEELERWAEKRGALMKSIEDAALAAASVFRSLGLPLPVRMPHAGEETRRAFTELLARFMPFDLVIDEENRDGVEVRVSRDSVCGSWGAIAGEIRYFAGRDGSPRAAVEGTQVPMDAIGRYATRTAARAVYDPDDRGSPLRLERALQYFGFELEVESERVDRFPREHSAAIRRALAESAARFEARHHSLKRNREVVELVRAVYRRSGGTTPRLGLEDLIAIYESRLENVWTLDEFRAAHLDVKVEDFVAADIVHEYMSLPSEVDIRGRVVPVEYDLEWEGDRAVPVARLRLPERLTRGLLEDELPRLDRPLRFVVPRGQRGAVRASSLTELHDALEQPWMRDEVADTAAAARTRTSDARKAGRQIRSKERRPRERHPRRRGHRR